MPITKVLSQTQHCDFRSKADGLNLYNGAWFKAFAALKDYFNKDSSVDNV